MVKIIEIEGKKGYLLTQKDYENFTQISYKNKNCYFMPFKYERTKLEKININKVIDLYKLSKSKKDICIELNISRSRLDGFLQRTYNTVSLEEISKKLEIETFTEADLDD